MPLADRKAIRLTVRQPAEKGAESVLKPEPIVWANPEQLQQIIANLLSNALKFTPEGGAVRVTVDVDPDTPEFGIGKATLAKEKGLSE